MNLTNTPPGFEIIITADPSGPGPYLINDMAPQIASEPTQIVFHLASAPPGVTLNGVALKTANPQISGNLNSPDGSTVIVNDADTAADIISFNIIINIPGGGTQVFDPQVINRPPGTQLAA